MQDHSFERMSENMYVITENDSSLIGLRRFCQPCKCSAVIQQILVFLISSCSDAQSLRVITQMQKDTAQFDLLVAQFQDP